MTVEFYCELHLTAYPFDKQKCSFEIHLEDISKDHIKTIYTGGVVFNGSKELREYEITSVDIIEEETHGTHNGYKVTITLANLYAYFLFSTYTPTFLMVVICWLTFYFPIDDFNDRIMVSLTALLVLATLFAQITQTTPNTSCLKVLDVWFVACIVAVFLIASCHVYINSLGNSYAPTSCGRNALFYDSKAVAHHKQKAAAMNKLLSRLAIFVGILFKMGYLSVCVWLIMTD